MQTKKKIQNIFKSLDRYSPKPFLYAFRMTKNEIELFDRKIKNSKAYLEYGMGGSLLRTIQKSKAKIYSVDSNVNWIYLMRKYRIVKNLENKRVFLYYMNVGTTKGWGHPINDEFKYLFPDYSSNVFDLIDKTTIDRVLIDGRFRVACTLKTIIECYKNENLEILIHDFWKRPQYHVVLKYLDEVDRADTLGVFKVKNAIDLSLVAQDYEHYKYNQL